MTNSLKTKLGRWAAGTLCAALILSACSTPELPSLPFGSTATPRPIEVTLFFTPPPAETPTPEAALETPTAESESATATSSPAPTPAPLGLPTTAPTSLPTEPPAELPIVAPAPTQTSLPTLPVVEVAAPRVVTVVTTVLVTVTVIATAHPVAATPKLTTTPSLRTTRTATPTLSAKSTSAITPTRTPARPRPTAVPVVTVAPANLSSVLAIAYKSNIKSDPWGVPFNEDGCTQFDDRRAGRKVYLEIIVRPLIAGVNSWNAQFYQGGSPFPTCISDPYIQHGVLRERDIPARGYPLPFEISKTLIAFVPDGQAVTRLNLFANGKPELCFALDGASANEIPCGS
jgi:hypothetical protein